MPSVSSSVNMREIARHAGVSVATVSKSLSNKSDVSAKTRAKILKVCAQLGYRPNPLVSALMRVRRRKGRASTRLTLAFVTAFPTENEWRKHPAPIFAQMFAGASQRALERNYRLEHFWLHRDGMSNARFSQVMIHRNITGLLLAPVPDTRTTIDLDWDAFSIVVLGLTPNTRRFHRVATDYYQSMMLSMEECFRLGYRRPGLAVRLETINRLERRWEGAYLVEGQRFSATTLPRPLFVEEWTAQNVAEWLEKEKPDVVIGPVLGALETHIRAAGFRIPNEIGLVGLVVPEWGNRLSGIFQDGEGMGAAAIDQLVAQIERNERGIPSHPVTHTMAVRWNPGRTLRKQHSEFHGC